MPARPPRASTKAGGKRPKARGATQEARPARPDDEILRARAGARPGEPVSCLGLLRDVTQLREQAAVTGASLGVAS